MENTFRVYLPSNASIDRFPKNKPADYQVQLSPPLHLDGKWEVGIENVCYDSAIENENEMEEIELTMNTYDDVPANERSDFPYVLTKDGKWNYEAIQLESDYYGASDPVKIIETLNSGNAKIMKDKKKKVYEFFIYNWRGTDFYRFRSFSSGLAMKLTAELSLHLGFGHGIHVSGDTTANKMRTNYSKSINKLHYQLWIFDRNIVEREERFIFKKRGEKPLSLKKLVKLWNNTIGKKFGDKARARKDKVVIYKHNYKVTAVFSTHLGSTVKFYHPLIGNGTFWAVSSYHYRTNATDEEWWVDVYGDRVRTPRISPKEYKATITIPPRQYATVDAFIEMLNPFMNRLLKDKMKSKYYTILHQIIFSIKDQKTVLEMGTAIKCRLSENLMKLFGFSQQLFTDTRTISMESPMTLDKREQHLYIQSDIIPPISFGERKEYILRDFIHDKDKQYGIIEKMFEPIFFHPIIKQDIPIIALKITNGLHECIHLKDTKTLVTLIFRKAK